MLPRGQYYGDQLEMRADAVYDSPLQLPKLLMRQTRHAGTPCVSPADNTQADPVWDFQRNMQDDTMCACLPL